MRKIFTKGLICAAIAGTMVLGGTGSVLAATDMAKNVALSDVDSAELSGVYSIGIDNFYVNNYGETEIGLSANGHAATYKLYVNGVLYKSSNGSEWDGSFNFYENFNMLAGASYTFKLDACDETGVVKATKTVTQKCSFPTFNSTSGTNIYGETYYDKNGNSTGFRKPVVFITQGVDDYQKHITYEVYRAENKKNAPYTKIDTITSWGSINYTDNTVVPGKRYYYKFCPVSGTDEYVKQSVKGSMSTPVKADVAAPTTSIYLEYTNSGINISMSAYTFASAFEIYRSTNSKNGYKLLDTISDTNYVDSTAKAGNTYYYKVKPVYYDIASKKLYKGKFSDVKNAKLILGNVYSGIEQTGVSQATITWDKVPGANTYEIWMKRDDYAGDAFRKVATTGGTKYVAKGLDKTGTYQFEVRACKASGGTVKYCASSINYITMGFHGITNIYVSKKNSKVSKDGKTVTVTSTIKWGRIYGANGYIVEAYDNIKGKKVTLKKITSGTTCSYKLTNPITVSGARYSSVYVTPYKGKVTTYASSVENVDMLPEVRNIKTKKKGSSSMSISWNKVVGATGYVVYKKSPTGNSIKVGETTSTSIIDKYITPDVNYTYCVEAINTKLRLYDNDEAYYGYNHSLSATSISSVKNSDKKTATVSWKKSPYAKNYIVYRSTSKNGKYNKVAVVASNKTSYKDTKLTKGNTYYYKVVVQAVNDAGINVTSKASKAKGVKISK